MLDRLEDKMLVGDGCWEWMACKDKDGYGIVAENGYHMRRAARVVYELWRSPIPEGLQIDHLCRNRGCVNPWHLEPVTQRENMLRGDTFAARHAAKTHCPRGHEYTLENTYRSKRGQRECRHCGRLKAKARYVPRTRSTA
jgi:hypothetical protein